MAAIMASVAVDESVIVSGELESCRHLLVRERPASVEVIEVIRAFLQEDSNRLPLSFADQCRVDVAASDVRIAADVAQDFAEHVGAFPGDSERTDPP